jgi:polyhydroxyalkanoate synthesis repressor PhaR
MVLIKRYQNRKLYDLENKRYVTLEGIAEMIRLGTEIQVIDNASGEDITTTTLTQIIFEQERNQDGYLSRSFLTGLIRAGGERLTAFQRSLRSPQNFLRQIDEEIGLRIQALVHAGELSENEGHGILEKLLSQTARLNERHRLDEKVQSILEKRQAPSRGDIQKLNEQLAALESKLADLNQPENQSQHF